MNKIAAYDSSSRDGVTAGQFAAVYGLTLLAFSQADLEGVRKRHACLESYSAGFPGGKEAFLVADASQIKRDLIHLESLFTGPTIRWNLPSQNFSPLLKSFREPLALEWRNRGDATAVVASQTIPEASDGAYSQPIPGQDSLTPDDLRRAQIRLGWDRTQVLLWGNYVHLKKLLAERNYKRILQETSTLRTTLGIRVSVPHVWDEAQHRTYYTSQTLRNMIVLLEYAARSKIVSTQPKAAALAREYLADEPSLEPFMTLVVDPGSQIIRSACSQER